MRKTDANIQYIKDQISRGKEFVNKNRLPYPHVFGKEVRGYILAQDGNRLILPSNTL